MVAHGDDQIGRGDRGPERRPVQRRRRLDDLPAAVRQPRRDGPARISIARPVEGQEVDRPAGAAQRAETGRQIGLEARHRIGAATGGRMAIEPRPDADRGTPRPAGDRAGTGRDHGGRPVPREDRVRPDQDAAHPESPQRDGRGLVPDRPDATQPRDGRDERAPDRPVERSDPDREQVHPTASEACEDRRDEQFDRQSQALVLEDPAAAQDDPVGRPDRPDRRGDGAQPGRDRARVGAPTSAGETGDFHAQRRGRRLDRVADRLVAEIVHPVVTDEEDPPTGRRRRRPGSRVAQASWGARAGRRSMHTRSRASPKGP